MRARVAGTRRCQVDLEPGTGITDAPTDGGCSGAPDGAGGDACTSTVDRPLRYTSIFMCRACVLLVLLFAMLWQSVALARPGSTVNVLADLEHAALHWQEQGHHHHDDGSYQLDDSQASTFHVVSDHLTATNALLPACSPHFPPSGSARPVGLHDGSVPAPFLDGLLRPPRLRA